MPAILPTIMSRVNFGPALLLPKSVITPTHQHPPLIADSIIGHVFHTATHDL